MSIQQKKQKNLLYTHLDLTETPAVSPQLDVEYKRIAAMPFWCADEMIHLVDPNYTKKGCCLTHTVGLPRHPATQLEMPLTPYQIDFVKIVIKAVTNPGNMPKEDWSRLHHAFHLLKGRQMGFTEIVLRLIQYFCFNRYAGRNVGIIAATNGELAKKDLRRLYRLFANIKDMLKGPLKGRIIEIINNTVVEAFPASEEALTGDTDYACIFMDESAKWKLVDDTPVFNSVLPIVRMNGSDFFVISTPKGPIKMFYKIYKDPQEFVMMEYDIWKAEGTIYTKEQIKTMLATTKEDPNQEYLCKFTIGEHSILGPVTAEDIDDNLTEWGDTGINEEDDGYTEPDDGLDKF